MKKAILIMAMVVLFAPNADACVGKVLNIGVIDSSEGKIFGELISTLITERTGTSVEVKTFGSPEELYGAVTDKNVDILVENTTRALEVLHRPQVDDAGKAYEIVKETYEKEKGLIWLKPFGFVNGSAEGLPSHTTTLLRNDILTNFPALPRVINKLGSKIDDTSYQKLMQSVESGEEPRDVAREFLKSRKLI